MVKLFGDRAPRLVDPRFGELRWSRGMWTSNNARLFGSIDVQLRIPGSREDLAPEALQLLASVEATYTTIKQQALPRFHDHYVPYVENLEELHDLAGSIRNAEDLWPHIKLVGVWVGAYGKADDVELAYRTAWDHEHTVGVTVSAGQIVEFCASI